MKFSLPLASFLATTVFTSFFPWKIAQASSFGEQQVNPEQFVLMAVPYRHGYNLIIVEQIPGRKQCWNETGTYPTSVEPLLINFDFSDHCKRSSDSNSYSIRLNGQDLGMDYLPDIVKRDGELHLIGTPRNPRLPELQIGRTYGLSSGSLKIVLNSGWNLSKRVYGGNLIDHVYLSSNSTLTEQIDRTAQFDSYSDNPSVIVDTITPPVSQFNPSSQSHLVEYEPETDSSVAQQPTYVYTSPQAQPVNQQSQSTPVYLAPPATPVYQQPQPTPVYLAPPATPVYQQPQPTPVYLAPQATPVYQQPQPVYVYTTPQAAPQTPPVYQINQQPPNTYVAPPVNTMYQQE